MVRKYKKTLEINLPKVLEHQKCFEQLDTPTAHCHYICNLCGKGLKLAWFLHGNPYGNNCIATVIFAHNKPELIQWYQKFFNPLQPYSGDLWRLIEPQFDRIVYTPPQIEDDGSEPF